MQRIIDDSLAEWKRSPFRKPIILQGALGTGKSYSTVEFGKKAYNGNYIKIDCSNREHALSLTPQNQNLGGLLAAIEKIHTSRINFEKTLVIIDKAQLIPAVYRLVKDLCEQRRSLHFILIGPVSAETETKFPWILTCYEHHRLYPMCFLEFLWACKKDKLAILTLETESKMDQDLHQEMVEELQTYILVGGMPEVVKCWIEESNLSKVREIQQEIVSKIYDLKIPNISNSSVLKSILHNVAYNAGYQIDFQTLSTEVAISQVKNCLDYLKEEGIVYRVRPSTPYSIPDINFKVKKFKTIFIDIGLLQIVSGIASGLDEEGASAFKMFEVALYDQFVGQELLMAQSTSVLYWASSVKESSARVNYLIPTSGSFANKGIPIVIQNEDMNSLLHSLDMCLGAHPNCNRAYILSIDASNKDDSQRNGKIQKIPLYHAMNLGMGS